VGSQKPSSLENVTTLLRPNLPAGWSYSLIDQGRIFLCYIVIDPVSYESHWKRTIILKPLNPKSSLHTDFDVLEIVNYNDKKEHSNSKKNITQILEMVKDLSTLEKPKVKKNNKKMRQYKLEGHPVGSKFSSTMKCKICAEIFSFEDAFVKFGFHENLLMHIQRHKNNMPQKRGKFKCTHCDKIFTYEYLLKQHEKRKHDPVNYVLNKTDKGEFSCKLCNKVLSQLRHLERHMKLVHEAEPNHRPFVCEVCGKAFKTKFNLSKHHKIHQERKHKCDQCSASFCERCELEYHKIVHTGEKPFLCHHCGKSFNTRTYLHAHQVKVCKVKAAKKIVKRPTPDERETPEVVEPLPTEHNTELKFTKNEVPAMDDNMTTKKTEEIEHADHIDDLSPTESTHKKRDVDVDIQTKESTLGPIPWNRLQLAPVPVQAHLDHKPFPDSPAIPAPLTTLCHYTESLQAITATPSNPLPQAMPVPVALLSCATSGSLPERGATFTIPPTQLAQLQIAEMPSTVLLSVERVTNSDGQPPFTVQPDSLTF